jgi:hypothetical protein
MDKITLSNDVRDIQFEIQEFSSVNIFVGVINWNCFSISMTGQIIVQV